MKAMTTKIAVSICGLFMVAGCVVAPAPYYESELPPPLPPTVVVGEDPVYFSNGYYYYYDHDRWQYSRDRGHWRELPRDRWPRETRYAGRGEGMGGFREHERGGEFTGRGGGGGFREHGRGDGFEEHERR